MGANKTPINKDMTKEKAISQGGYYNTDGDWNCIVTVDEYPGKILRGRVEVLIFKDGKLFMFLKENGKYRIPGGGFDKGVLNKDQAFIETKEEAKMLIKNIRYSGVTYIQIYDEIWKHGENEIPYDGTYNEVYIADYKDDYVGYIRKGLSDMELTKKGKFYALDDVKDFLKEPHKQALMNMINNIVTESTSDSDLIITAQQFQKTLNNLHNKLDDYWCIRNRDIESDDGGFIFGEYYTSNKEEEDKVKKFIDWCNSVIATTAYVGHVREPISFKGYGFLFIEDEDAIHNNEQCYDILTESNILEYAKELKDKKYPIFILNTYTATPMGKIIRNAINTIYTHSAIALDSSLEKLYSFNGNNNVNKFGGFSKESLSSYIKYNKDCLIQLNCIFVGKKEIETIKEKLDYFIKNQKNTKFDFGNFFNVLLNKSIETKDDMMMICSQFVSYILSIADVHLLDKSINLITPKDLSSLNTPKVYLLYEGLGRDYDEKKLDKIFNKLMNKAQSIKDN